MNQLPSQMLSLIDAYERGPELLAAAVTTLRRILVEHGRRRGRMKRGGHIARVTRLARVF